MTFLDRICKAYTERFSDLQHLPDAVPLTLEDSFGALTQRYPGLLARAGAAVVALKEAGANELGGLLAALEAPSKDDSDDTVG